MDGLADAARRHEKAYIDHFYKEELAMDTVSSIVLKINRLIAYTRKNTSHLKFNHQIYHLIDSVQMELQKSTYYSLHSFLYNLMEIIHRAKLHLKPTADASAVQIFAEDMITIIAPYMVRCYII